MRPDLIGTEPWLKKKLERGSEKYNDLLTKNTYWWREANTDKFGKLIENMLDNGDGIRYGIFHKFLVKADKPEHLRVILKCLTWLQARWDKDITSEVAVPLSKAIYRTRSPDLGMQILNAPWIRLWPSMKSIKPLFLLCAELSEKECFKYPNTGHMRYPPVGKSELPDDFVPIKKRQMNVRDYEAAIEEENAEDESEGEKWVEKPINLDQSYSKILRYATDPRFGLTLDQEVVALQAEYWANKGDTSQVENLIKKLETAPKPKRPIIFKKTQDHLVIDHLLPTAYLASGRAEECLNAVNPNTRTPKTWRAKIAAQLSLGDPLAAVDTLKQLKNINRLEYVQTHLGHLERLETVHNAYQTFKEEGAQIHEEIWNYFKKSSQALNNK
ncbi:uncharacterized protein LOC126317466 isoform X2 [Schistocerca gregaria]|nr:uncharacterized protein LOC126317466 isoform X2 [Schistocerca gregaria]